MSMITYSINIQRVLPGLAACVWLHVAARWEATGFGSPAWETVCRNSLLVIVQALHARDPPTCLAILRIWATYVQSNVQRI